MARKRLVPDRLTVEHVAEQFDEKLDEMEKAPTMYSARVRGIARASPPSSVSLLRPVA